MLLPPERDQFICFWLNTNTYIAVWYLSILYHPIYFIHGGINLDANTNAYWCLYLSIIFYRSYYLQKGIDLCLYQSILFHLCYFLRGEINLCCQQQTCLSLYTMFIFTIRYYDSYSSLIFIILLNSMNLYNIIYY